MNLILVKMFATALALSQVTTRPDAVRTEFDPVSDQGEVVQILRDGCKHIRKEFDVEDFNLDDLINTAMQDPAKRTLDDVSTFTSVRVNFQLGGVSQDQAKDVVDRFKRR